MQNIKTSWLKRAQSAIAGALLLATVAVVASLYAITPVAQAQSVSAPSINWVYVDPQTFDPSKEDTKIHWEVSDETAYVEAGIYDGSNISTANEVRSLIGTAPGYAVPNPLTWNGQNDQYNDVAEGTYYFYIKVTNDYGTDTWGVPVHVEYETPDLPTPTISNHYASPSTFDPATQSTKINFTLDQTAVTTVEILDGSNKVFGLLTNSTLPAGSSWITWAGTNSQGVRVTDKAYTYRITAKNSEGDTAAVTGTVTVKSATPTPTKPQLSSVTANKSVIDPTNNEWVTVNFNLSEDATVEMQVYSTTSGVAAIYTTTGQYSKGSKAVAWNGHTQTGSTAPEGYYNLYLVPSNSAGTGQGVWVYSIKVDYNDPEPPTPTTPQITNVYATPYTINPDNNETTRIYYTVDQSVKITVDIWDGSNLIANLVNISNIPAGTASAKWGGHYQNGTKVPEKNYTYRITAVNSAGKSDIETGTIYVDYEGNNTNTAPNISNYYATPSTFDPEDGERTNIHYTIDKYADVTVQILDGSTLVKELQWDAPRAKGSYNIYWDGEDRYDDIVEEGTYRFKITACNTDDNCDTRYGNVSVDIYGNNNNNSDDLISDIEINNAIFDPTEREKAELCFVSEEDNTEFTVEILDGSKVIKTLLDQVEYDNNWRRCVEWNGKNKSNDIVGDDVYQFRIRAEKGNRVQVEYEYTEVDTDGRIIGFPKDNEYCGGFRDVPRTSPFCKAIELMGYRGVFDGYDDGTFRPYAPINRAEATKVILLALDTKILSDDGSNQGFWDVQRNSWYTRYLRTAKRLGIIGGYPDGSFKPNATVNRVELLKIFLEANELSLPYCNQSPYPDTPNNRDTKWYIDYACFAKAYGLMGTDSNGNFNPAQPMTRGDVANLFYALENRGFYGGNSSSYNYGYYNDYYSNYNPYSYSSYGYDYYRPYQW